MERKSSKKIQRLQSNIPLSLREGQGFFGCWDPSLGETLEPFEGVVDEDPVLVRLPGVVVRWRHWNEVDQNTARQSVPGFLPILRATSGKSSKLEVSSIDLTCTGMAAGLSLMCPQSTPLNQSRLLMSSIHWSLWSLSSQNLNINTEREREREGVLTSPHYSLTSSLGYRNLGWKLQRTLPVHHLPVCFLGGL